VEVADRCWVARYDFLDVNVGVVAGDRGLLVVDTHASEVEARIVVEQVRRLGMGDVVAVVNTHRHFDHAFGNAAFCEEYDGLELLAHEEAAAALALTAPALQAEARRQSEDPEEPERQRQADIAAARVVVPDQTFCSARGIDLGDRFVELVHPGRGHTDGDIVVRVPDADVMFAGDLVEESARSGGVPGFGDDCFPMDWPDTMDLVISMLTARSVVVPGHGLPVDLGYVQEQRHGIGTVAETIRDLASRGVSAADAMTSAAWPYPVEDLRHAVARGYEHLPRSARSLPLL